MLNQIDNRARVVTWLLLVGVLGYPALGFSSTFGEATSIPIKLKCGASKTEKFTPPKDTKSVTLIVSNKGRKGWCSISVNPDWADVIHVSPGDTTSQTLSAPKGKLGNIKITCDEPGESCEGTLRIVPLTGTAASTSPLALLPEDPKAKENFTAKCGADEVIVLRHSGSKEALMITVDNLGDCDVMVRNDGDTEVVTASQGAKVPAKGKSVSLTLPTAKIWAKCKGDKAKSCKAAITVELSAQK